MTIARRFLAALLALLIAAPAFAQVRRSYSQPELDQMLAPIALYPDALLSQVLIAATYPQEVAQAARWSRANPGLQGDDAVRAAQQEAWDPSVQSLLAFPQVLQRMDENLDWTRALGDAFLTQQPPVMDTVQQLRHRAQAAGNLQSDAQIRVEQQGPAIVVQPASPTVVYVPYYDPLIVYGPWWWPAYRPVYWAPWPGYVRMYPGIAAGFWWGRPVGLSLNFFFGNFDWQRRQLRVVHAGGPYYRPPVTVNRTAVIERDRWRREPPLPQVQQRAQLQARPQVQERPRPAALPVARMPAAIAPQQPRADRHEHRQDRREHRQERGQKS